MSYVLQVSSSDQLVFNPEYDFDDGVKKIEDRTRVKGGAEFVYKHAEYVDIKFSIMYVDSSFKTTVNSWWGGNQVLQFYETGTTDVSTVRIAGRGRPVTKLVKPYSDLFKGKIKLEGA